MSSKPVFSGHAQPFTPGGERKVAPAFPAPSLHPTTLTFGKTTSVANDQVAMTSTAKRPVRFSGFGDMVSSGINAIDGHRLLELLLLDFLGMLVPRTTIATTYRGVDDGRETFIRETTGIFCVGLLAGFIHLGLVNGVGNRLNPFNPHGTPTKAWVNAKTLTTFSHLYEDTLNTAPHNATPAQVRERFVERILKGMESTDANLSVEGRLGTLKSLADGPDGEADAKKLLNQMLVDRFGNHVNPALKGRAHNALNKGLQSDDLSELRNILVKEGGWGKLSEAGAKELGEWFHPQKASEAGHLKGTIPFDARAHQQLSDLEKLSPIQNRERTFIKQRLSMALADLENREPQFMKAVNQIALNRDLTSTLHLKDANGKILLGQQSRDTLLKELKHFLEHYVDRAAFDVEHQPGRSHLPWEDQKRLLHKALFASPNKGLAALLPHSSDGLVTATLRAKSGYLWIPLLLTFAANGIFTFANNRLTQNKHNGRVYFPGEEAALQRSRHVQQANNLSDQEVLA